MEKSPIKYIFKLYRNERENQFSMLIMSNDFFYEKQSKKKNLKCKFYCAWNFLNITYVFGKFEGKKI